MITENTKLQKKASELKTKKTCFVVTPIGKPESDIRRHIDGIINIAIEPALGSEFSIEAAHTYFNSTSITKQVYQKLYECDLVIANLTELNPNVMYELGIRFCFGKPTILIAKKDTKLPFDINEQRTFFYKDDALGMLELKESLEKIKETLTTDKIESPIHDALKEVQLFEQLNSENDINNKTINEMLSIIMKKIDKYSDDSLLEENELTNIAIDRTYNYYDDIYNKCQKVLNELSELEEGPFTQRKMHICHGHFYECLETYDKLKNNLNRDQYILLGNIISNIKRRISKLENKL